MKNLLYIDFNSDAINAYYDNNGVGESKRIPINELMDILIEYTKKNNIKNVNDLVEEGLIQIENSALDEFNKIVVPVVQNAIAPLEEENTMEDETAIEKVYIHQNGEEGTYYIQYKDGTIAQTSREDAIQELESYMMKNNLSEEQVDELGLIEEIDEDKLKTLLGQQSTSTSQEPEDENTFNDETAIEKVYIHQNGEEGTYYIQYKDGTIAQTSREDAIQELESYMMKNNLSEEQVDELGLIEEIDEDKLKTLLGQQSTSTSQEPEDENTFNIEKIYTYWQTNSEDPEKEEELRGIICYKDGTKKDKEKSGLRQDIIDCMEEYAVKSIKDLEELGVLEEISEEKANSILESISEIGKIVFFSYITNNKEIETRAMIYYTDGRVKEVSREEAEKEILNIKRANNIEKTEQLFKENFLESATLSELHQNHSDYMEQAKNNEGKYASAVPELKKKEKKTKKKKANIFKRICKKLKTNKLVRWISIGLAAISVLGTASCTAYKLVHKSPIGNVKDENTQEDTKDDSTINVTPDNAVREDFSVYSYDELTQRCKTNKARQEAMQTIYSFITDYNLTTSYLYKEAKSPKKLSHTVDEASAMYLLYNDINPETVNEIYRSTSFDATQLRNDLINAQKQDSLAHNIQTKTINKDKLFTDSEAKKLYNKYEEISIKMNDTSSYDKKAEYKKEFNDMVRSDLSGMASNSYENVDSSKIVIKEFVDAMQRVKIDVDNELTDQEVKYIDGILENVVDKKIKDIVTKQNARNQEATIEYDEGKMIDSNPYYTEFKDAIIKELESKDAYYTTENDRDITDYKKFKENIKPEQYDKKESVAETEAKPEKTNNQTASSKKSEAPTTPPAQTAPSQPAQTAPSQPEEQAPVETDIIEETHEVISKKHIDVLEKSSNTVMRDVIDTPERIPIDIPERIPIDPIIPITPDDGLELVEIRRPDGEPVFPPINQGIEEIPIDNVENEEEDENLIPEGMENSEIEFITSDETTIENKISNEGIIEIDADKKDEDGNLINQYTDVSTDLEATTTYPTNNSEEIADFLIQQMEQQSESYTEETTYVR